MSRKATSKQLRGDLNAIRAFVDGLLATYPTNETSDRYTTVLDELLRRNEFPAQDGYPSSSLGGGGGSDISRPTERAAFQNPPDQTGRYISDIADLIEAMAKDARRGDGLRTRALDIGEEERGRTSTVPDCVNPHCGKSLIGEGPNDRGISGRCNNCYKWRYEHGGMDRPAKLVEAERQRDAQVAS